MDLDDRVEPADGPFARVFLGVHTAPQPGRIREIPKEDQSRPKSNPAAPKCPRPDLPQDTTVAFGLRAAGAEKPVRGECAGPGVDGSRHGPSGDRGRHGGT